MQVSRFTSSSSLLHHLLSCTLFALFSFLLQQPLYFLRRLCAFARGMDEHAQIAGVAGLDPEEVKMQLTCQGMVHSFVAFGDVLDIVVGPEFAEFGADATELCNLCGPPGIVDEAAIAGAELAQVDAGDFCPFFVVSGEAGPGCEETPDEVALALALVGVSAENDLEGSIAGYDVQACVRDAGWHEGHLVEKLLGDRADDWWGEGGNGWWLVEGQQEEVGAFVLVQAQGIRQTFQNLHGDVDVPSLFQPGVPFGANSGQGGYFASAQARGAPACSSWQARLFWREASAATTQEGGEFVMAIQFQLM